MQKPPFPSGKPDPGYERIIVALEAILASEKFLAAPQMSAFLRYVVEQAANGNKVRIKAYTVAVDALGKPETFDPQNDPVVRVLAGRLRSSLSAYYENRPNEDVKIVMKPGSYVPVFTLKNRDTEAASGDDSEEPVDEELNHSAAAANNNLSKSDLAMDTDVFSQDNKQKSGSQTTPGSSNQNTPPFQPSDKNSELFFWQVETALFYLPRTFPRMSMAAALLLAFLAGTLTHQLLAPNEPSMQAATPSQVQPKPNLTFSRKRPENLSLFISAIDQSGSLASQLSTMMSNTFSESADIRVHRLLRSAQSQQFWPEDYVVSINVLPLSDQTQVSVQLVEAQSGLLAYTEYLHLSSNAAQGLSEEELNSISDFARHLISKDGPLRTDYQAKKAKING